jgi:hypothetical protein
MEKALIIYLVFMVLATLGISALLLKMRVRHPLRLIFIILLLIASPVIFSYILLTYFAPLPEAVVPDLMGLSEQQAADSLNKLGLSYKVESRYENENIVTFQRPEPGRLVKRGRTVSLVIGKPVTVSPAPVSTPEVTITPPVPAPPPPEPKPEGEVEGEKTEEAPPSTW